MQTPPLSADVIAGPMILLGLASILLPLLLIAGVVALTIYLIRRRKK